MRGWVLLGCALGSATAAHASDKPLYAPAPAWVVPAPPIDPKATDAGQAMLIFDQQQRLEKGVTTAYMETALRATTAQALGEMGNVALPWMPDRGDLIIHTAELIRGTQKIDLLKGGERFVVLRREQQLEQRTLTGMLTATMTVEGLQVGDVLHMAFSITSADKALDGRAVAAMITPPSPFPLKSGRARLLWPAADKVAWRAYGAGAVTREATVGTDHEVTVALPLPRAPDMPGDQPARFSPPPLLEATTFTSWEDVSRTLAPLYATEGLIAPGSPLAAEAAKIRREPDPLKRTQAALALVQEQVRYLAIAMDGGGLTPQTPARTWELRYGDCKAKTLLLLALLRDAGIEAEPVTASAQLSGFVEKRLPSAAAFDHILVRATVNGETLWLDGTGSGAMLADIRDTPAFRYVLPLRTGGSGLLPLPSHADARPSRIVAIDYDQRGGIRLPALFTATITLRGAAAQMMKTVAGAADAKQRADLLDGIVTAEIGDARVVTRDLRFDPASGTATVVASGIMTTPWRREERQYRVDLDRALGAISFAPDRARAAWRDLPVTTGGPEGVLYRTTVKLPLAGQGFAFEGATTLPPVIAGRVVKRTASLSGDTVTVEDRVDTTGAEIAPDALAAARGTFATAKAKQLRLIAPAAAGDQLAGLALARKNGTLRAIEASYAAMIAADADRADAYVNRANFRRIFDAQGAIADLTKAITLEDSVATRRTRASIYEQIGNDRAAIADYEAALAIDGADVTTLTALTQAQARSGNGKAALVLLDERIANAGSDKADLVAAKAQVLADTGDAPGAIALLDTALVERPGSPDLLNTRCWIKGAYKVGLDTAVKDCTRSIEGADDPAGALDSRAMAYLRLGRLEDAKADLDAVLLRRPDQAESRFLRALILKQQGKTAEAAQDLAAARLQSPRIDADYARYGLKP